MATAEGAAEGAAAEGMEEADYASDASITSTTTTTQCRTRKAFLVREGEDGVAQRLAFGECREADGVFAVAPNGVFADAEDVDVAGEELGAMPEGGLLNLDDLDECEFDLEYLDEDEGEDEGEAGDLMTDMAGAAGGSATPMEVDEAQVWREEVQRQADELAWCRDALADAETKSHVEYLRAYGDVDSLRVRVEVEDPKDKRTTKLVPIEELLRECKRKREAPPLLTPTERVRKAQMTNGAYKAVYRDLSQQLRGQMEEQERRHQHERRQRELEHSFMVRLQQRSLKKQAESQLQSADDSHQRELHARAARTATWTRKRNNMTRSLKRSNAARDHERERAAAAAADAHAAAADNSELHAKLGTSVQVAEQRQHKGSRTAFAFSTIHRDLQTRQHSLNSGAANLSTVTQIYSQHIAADGRDLKLESGSRRSVLRWEKTADVLCMIIEGRQLRSAILAEPRTRVHFSVDLSPDSRAVEQFGCLFEYAGIEYLSGEADAPVPFATERLHGAPLGSCATARFGADGCPITIEWTQRIFTPMLAALGPKYASTCDCFLRTMQLYGSTPAQLTDESFTFATAERLDVSVPLLPHIENFTADAGGEVHKSGGVIETCTEGKASYRHCGAHGGNLSLEKSIAFDKVGGSIRSISSFLRNGNKQHLLVHHMKRIQRPELAESDANCDARRLQIYRDAHEQVRAHGQFHKALGGVEASPDAYLQAELHVQALVLALVEDAKLEKKSKKGTDVRWQYECQVLHDRLLDVAHLLAPAILIMYGVGTTYAELTMDEERNKMACTALALLVDPHFIFWSTHLRLLYTRVYKDLFVAVQANHHHAAPELSGPNGLPVQWAGRMRAAVVEPKSKKGKGKKTLSEVAAAPLLNLLQRHKQLGGVNGQYAAEAIADFEAQAGHLEAYFARWKSLEGLVHTVALECVLQGPLTEATCALAEGRREEVPAAEGETARRLRPRKPFSGPLTEELAAGHEERQRQRQEAEAPPTLNEADVLDSRLRWFDLLPRVPAPEALEAAKLGIEQFEAAGEEKQRELPGTLAWLLFSRTNRDGSTNPIFANVEAFAAAGELNKFTGYAFPYRCWPELAKVLVAGGAKYCMSTSAQLESLFTGLTRQQGASKNHISQAQVAFEARCRKNPTMDALTRAALEMGWAEAKAVQSALDKKGFWVCDMGLAADRSLSKKLKEQREIELAEEAETAEEEGASESIGSYEVERIVRHERLRATGEMQYVVKWKGWESKDNTKEPESHLLKCKELVAYWERLVNDPKKKSSRKTNQEQAVRVAKLQEEALPETHRRTQPLQPEPAAAAANADANATPTNGAAAAGRPAAADVLLSTRQAYDCAHAALANAVCLVFDTETSGFTGCVLDLGWILADAGGKALVSYERLWQLPPRERIDRRAFKAHGISDERLRREGVPAKPEVGEFMALIAAALAKDVRIVAHNASFDVRVLNLTAIKHGLVASLRSAEMLCTMHTATKHCGLRRRGDKRTKAPRNDELYYFLFRRKPSERLHRALPDCCVTLASYIEGRKRRWW